MKNPFDVIVIGAGAAGCVIASRLSESPRRTVLLLEAGPDLPLDKVPNDIADTFPESYYNKSYMWPGLKAYWRRKDDSPPVIFDQGRILGGGSAVMGMVALRGVPADYDEWAATGADGWGWADVLPYFRRLETDLDFADHMHGTDGPITIRRTPESQWPPMARALKAHAAVAGMPFVPDMNGDFRTGCGHLPLSATATQRSGSLIDYLGADVRRRDNLTIVTGTTALTLTFEGNRATGVRAAGLDGEVSYAGRRIVLSGGAIQSPSLLMRSGVGPAAAMRALDIPVVADLPGVGQNLQNHAALYLGAHLKRRARQSPALRPHSVCCLRYSSGIDGAPPLDMYLNVQSKSSWSALGRQVANLGVMLLKPASRGRVSLVSGDPEVMPLIEFGFLSEEIDLRRMKAGFARLVEFSATPAVNSLCTTIFPVKLTDRLRRLNARKASNAFGSALLAGALDFAPASAGPVFRALTDRKADLAALTCDDDVLEEHVRANVAGAFHVVGTCRMGRPSDPGSVVDQSGQVHHLGGLYVADASIMPAIPRGNTNIPTVMLAEKLAEGIRGEDDRQA